MGNHGSKRCNRKTRGLKCRYGQAKDELSVSDDRLIPTERFKGTTPDSYDKLLAWMVEMAENDEADLTSSAVAHLTTMCADKPEQSTPPSASSALSVRQSSLEVPVPQHSLDSSGSSHNSDTSKCREDLSHPKTKFRRAMLSRQSTIDYSDDSDAHNEVFGNGSIESEMDNNFVSPDSFLINSIEETSFTNRPRPPLRKNQSCMTYRNYNANIADLLNVNSRKKSKSLMTMRKMLSETRNDEEMAPITEETVIKVLGDDMLDGNIADILYSVEALWPKPPK
ncbi:uncharacterized protein LOC123542952 [Mercenaria mercenaria]|uniref:uncharacterized protein LOC123542952 n=1 Tax=Mercenaria mercenaria TaxID=6596 RepID=UPI00234FB01B|nr:uncharacterized protein LOC123542952 [Mercenaria mercenaria]